MDDQTRSVLTCVDSRELVDLASALIRIPSFKTEETEVARFLEKFFRERDYTVDLQEIEPGRSQTIATLRGTGGGASLMLNGHTDINALTRRWKRDPWTPSLEGDRLYGHGVQNMKGGLASIIMAAEAVRRSGVRLAGDLVVACVTFRETGERPGQRARTEVHEAVKVLRMAGEQLFLCTLVGAVATDRSQILGPVVAWHRKGWWKRPAVRRLEKAIELNAPQHFGELARRPVAER